MIEHHLEKRIKKENDLLTPISNLDISIRLTQLLKSININTLGDIVSHEEDFFTPENIRGLSTFSKKELDTILKENNLTFKK